MGWGRRDTWVPPYNSIFFVGQGPCALPGAEKESPSHGFAVTAPFRQEGLGDGSYGLSRALRALAMTRGFCKECGCIIDGAVGGQPQGSPQRKIRVIFRDLLRGLIAGISPGGAVV